MRFRGVWWWWEAEQGKLCCSQPPQTNMRLMILNCGVTQGREVVSSFVLVLGSSGRSIPTMVQEGLLTDLCTSFV